MQTPTHEKWMDEKAEADQHVCRIRVIITNDLDEEIVNIDGPVYTTDEDTVEVAYRALRDMHTFIENESARQVEDDKVAE